MVKIIYSGTVNSWLTVFSFTYFSVWSFASPSFWHIQVIETFPEGEQNSYVWLLDIIYSGIQVKKKFHPEIWSKKSFWNFQ